MRYELPSGWTAPQFKAVAEVVTGSTPSKSDEANYGGETPFVTPAELGFSEPVLTASTTLSNQGAAKARLLPPHSVLVCCIGSLGKVGFLGCEAATNQQINALVFDQSQVEPRYGYHFCRTLKPLLTHMAPATTVAIVNKGRFQELKIPLPPLAEQKRIAAILDKADAIRRKRQEAIALTEELLRSAFLEMFGDPVTNPKGWEVVELNSLVREGDKINYGVVQPGSDFENGKPLIRVGDLVSGRVVLDDMKTIDPEIEAKYSRSRLVGDELLVGCVGSVGAIALAQAEHRGFNIARAVSRVPLDLKKIQREYIAAYLRTDFVQKFFRSEIRVVAQPTLNVRQLKETPVLLPPIQKQSEFSAFAISRTKMVKHQVETAVMHDNLFNALVQRAFKGEL